MLTVCTFLVKTFCSFAVFKKITSICLVCFFICVIYRFSVICWLKQINIYMTEHNKMMITNTYSTVEVWQCEINILCMVWQDRADLKVRASFYSWWWFESEDSLKTVDTVFDIGRVRCSEMFSKSKQSGIPCIRLLLCCSWGHRHTSNTGYTENIEHRIYYTNL